MIDSKLSINIKANQAQEEPVETILVVDDSPTVIAFAKKMLEENYTIVSATNGLEAWEILNDNKTISLVFSDMQMPIMNGLELLLKIRNADDLRLAKMPVVMITGKTDSEAGKKAVFDIGATDFIGKPFDKLALLTRAKALVQRSGAHRKRLTDAGFDEREKLASASSFHSIGCQALEFSRSSKSSITVVYVSIDNYHEIEQRVGEKSAMAIMLAIVKRVGETVRDEDVMTRLGVNKLAVLYNLVGSTSSAVVGRLINHLQELEFEYDDQPLEVDIRRGCENSKSHGKDVTFSEICMRADSNLKVSSESTVYDENTNRSGGRFGDLLFDEFKSRGRKIGLWFALKSVVSGDFDDIPKQYEPELMARMKDYIEHLEKQRKT